MATEQKSWGEGEQQGPNTSEWIRSYLRKMPGESPECSQVVGLKESWVLFPGFDCMRGSEWFLAICFFLSPDKNSLLPSKKKKKTFLILLRKNLSFPPHPLKALSEYKETVHLLLNGQSAWSVFVYGFFKSLDWPTFPNDASLYHQRFNSYLKCCHYLE